MIYHHQLNPWVFRWADQALSWYWASYFIGFLLVLFLGLRLVETHRVLKRQDYLSYLQIAFPLMILSSRIFYVLFYHPQFFLDNPLMIPQFWRGGMSFHGALLGPLLYAWWFARKKETSFLSLLDHLVIPASLGLFFGRIGNFINGELAGIPTNQQWGVVFSGLYDQQARHPVQLYQAFSEGLLLFCLLWFFAKKKSSLKYAGLSTSIFLMGYGLFRFTTEFWREPDVQIGKVLGLNLGQWFCLLMIIIGLSFLRKVSQSFSETTRYSAS